MTVVTFDRDTDSFSVTAKGHAEGDTDQVCAAISQSMYELAGYVLNEKAIDCIGIKLQPGDTEISWAGYREAEAAYMMTMIGLTQLALENPSYLEIRNNYGEKA
jgi:Predicted ribosomal protein